MAGHLPTAGQPAFANPGEEPDQLGRLEVAHLGRVGVLADGDRVTPERQEPAHAERRSAEGVRGEGDPVAIADGHLEDHVDALRPHDRGRRQRRHPHRARAPSVTLTASAISPHWARARAHGRGVRASRRHQLARDGERRPLRGHRAIVAGAAGDELTMIRAPVASSGRRRPCPARSHRPMRPRSRSR